MAGTHVGSTLLIVALIVLLIAILPTWPYSTSWGFYPSSGVALFILLLLVLMLFGPI